MASPIAEAFVALMPDTDGFGPAVERQVGGQVGGTGKRTGAIFGKAFALAGGLLAAAGIGSFLKGSIDEAREAQKVGAATGAILKATGNAANLSAGDIGNLASALSAKTAIDDEQIQAGENLLLTFKNVKREGAGLNDVFGRATAAGLDLAAAGFGSVEGNAKQLGKALNDPLKGIAALSKSGVTFTDSQKEQIEGFVKSNDLLSAQKIILGEVEKQVGGTAAATATSGEKAAVAFGNIKEQVGTALLPVVDGFFNLFLSQVPRITSIISGIGPAFGAVQAFITPFAAQVSALFSGGGGGGLLSGIGSLASAVQANLLPVLQAMASTFTGTILPAVISFATYVTSALLPVFQQVASIVIGQVLPILARVGVFLYGTLYPAIVTIVGAVASRLKPVFDQLVATFRADVLPAVSQLLAAFQRAQPTIQKVALVVVRVIGFVAKLGATILGAVLPPLIRFAGFLIRNAVPALIGVVSTIARAVGSVINFGRAVGNGAQAVAQFAVKVGEKITKAVKFFIELPGKITGALAGLPGKLISIGGNIVDGLVSGIRAAGARVTAAIRGIVDKIPKFIREKMGIASPSKVTTILGEFIGAGLAVGITSSKTKITKAIGKVLDAAKDKLSQRIDDLKSLSSTISDNLTGNLFSGFDTASSFVANLASVKGNLGGLLSAFQTLRGYGLPVAFLAKLYSDGGAPLILDLAANKAQAASAASLFGDITNLGLMLGNNVATADIGGGASLADLNETLKVINKNLQKVPDGVGDKVNGAATGGKKRGNRGGGKGGKS